MDFKHRRAQKSSGKGQGKVTKIQSKMQRVFNAFNGQPKTVLMVSVETGVLRADIVRCITKLEQRNRIGVVRIGICPVSKHRAEFYTTDFELFPTVKPKTLRI
jgi:nitrogen regulatory protein PII